MMLILLVLRPLLHLLRKSGEEDVIQKSTSVFSFFRFNPSLQRLLPLLLILLCSCHWAGCLYWCVASLERDPTAPTAWLPSAWLTTQDVGTRYMHAFLWGISTMTGFMPYDVEPATAVEAGVTALMMLIAIFINTVIISSTTTALQAHPGPVYHCLLVATPGYFLSDYDFYRNTLQRTTAHHHTPACSTTHYPPHAVLRSLSSRHLACRCVCCVGARGGYITTYLPLPIYTPMDPSLRSMDSKHLLTTDY